MWNWFQTRCPVDLRDQTWIESRFDWLVQQLGAKQLRNTPVILPGSPYFPQRWQGEESETRELFQKFCEWMHIPADSVGLEFVDDEQLPNAAGHYDYTLETLEEQQRPQIRLRRTTLRNAPQLAAAIAHELAHHILLTLRNLEMSDSDHEQVTDLVPLFYGLGVVQANATIVEEYQQSGNVSWWSLYRQGYLSSHQLGYALALFAWFRGESSPAWAKELRLDAATTMKAGLKYLTKMGSELFQPDSLAFQRSTWPGETAVLEDLRSQTPTRVLNRLWQLCEEPPSDRNVVDAVLDLVDHRQATIASTAIDVLTSLEPGQLGRGTDLLVRAIEDPREDIQASALAALTNHCVAREQVLPVLTQFLRDDRDQLVIRAAQALQAYGSLPEEVLAALTRRTVQAISRGEVKIESALIWALIHCTTDPIAEIEKIVNRREDPDEYRHVVVVVQETMQLLPCREKA